MTLAKILVAIDFSESSLQALEQAVRVAERTGASLILVWVESEAAHAPSGAAIYGTALQEVRAFIEQLRAEAEAQLRTLADGLVQRGVEVSIWVERGDPADIVVELGQREQVDLICTGTKGLTGFKRFFLGSVASKVARMSTVPVLVSRSDTDSFRRILVAMDFSPASESALALAVAVAAPKAVIDVCHVWRYPPGMFGVDAPELEEGPFGNLREDIIKRASARGNALITRYASDDVSMNLILEYGLPAGKLHEHADAGQYDLVAMGTHGYRGLQRFLLGSVAETMVRHAPCSILIAHAPDTEEAGRD